MEKVILFIDNGNANFFVENEDKKYFLPTLDSNKNIVNDIQKKYNLSVTKIIKLEENDTELSVYRCYVNAKVENNFLILNDIINLPLDTKHYNLIVKYNSLVLNESLKDSFWLGIILSVVDKLNDKVTKHVISNFLLMFSTIFCNELIKYKYGEKSDTIKTSVNISGLRNFFLKDNPLYNSKNTQKFLMIWGLILIIVHLM